MDRKTLIRNIEIPLNDKNPRFIKYTSNNVKQNEEKEIIPIKQCNRNYQLPAINTNHIIANEITALSHLKSLKIANTNNLSPRSKNSVIKEVTKQLNFHPDKIVYKNLVSINVNDSVLQPEFRTYKKEKKCYSHHTDPVPDFVNFLTPIEPLKLVLPMYNKSPKMFKPKTGNFDEVREFVLNLDNDWE